MTEVEIESRQKVKRLLKELFQFDMQDLDFGIYRIMNFKRNEIEKFIEEDLIRAAEEEFREYAQVGMADLQKEVEKLRAEIVRDFGEGTIDNQGNVRKHEDAPKIKEYLKKLKELGDAKLTRGQIDDVFNHIYEFFSRYYEHGDFLSKRRYGGREKYFVPYNGEEVLLHWATRDQYYVKTGEYFKKYSFKAGKYEVNFTLRENENDPNDVKPGHRYFLLSNENNLKLDEENKELDIFFDYRKLTDPEKRKYRTRNIQKAITSETVNKLLLGIGDKGPGIELRRKSDQNDVTLLEKHIAEYVKKHTADYFIHRNLKSFLESELDFYLKNEVLDVDEIERMDERNIRANKAKIRAIKEISRKIIDFLSQIENFQKSLFEKKKFVLNVEYCMTLDMVPEAFYREIGQNKQQVTEWKKLFKLDEITKETLQSIAGKATLDPNFLKTHKYLVLDTKFFSEEFKDALLERFDNLDAKIGGVLVKSENFQALNLLKTRYENAVSCIYIDPPYNTGTDEFLYKDNYQHSSWLSMMENRLVLAKTLCRDDCVAFISINDIESNSFRIMMKEIFGVDSFIGPIIWKSRQNVDNRTLTGFSNDHEYVLCFGKKVRGAERDTSQYSNPDIDPRGPWASANMVGILPESKRPNCHFDLINPETGINYGKPKMGWRFDRNTMQRLIAEKRILWPKDPKGRPRQKAFLNELSREFVGFSSVIKERIFTYHGSKEFDDLFLSKSLFYPKPTSLIEILIEQTPKENAIILDFFAGSGTTANAVLNLNKRCDSERKFILIDMADYFETFLKPRVEKIMFSSKWKGGLPISNEGVSHMFKYVYLEQYEDTLNNITFRAFDKTIQETLDSFKDYFLRFMLDYETRESPTRLLVDKFNTPFDYKIKTIGGNQEKEETVNLVETFNYLLGLDVERLRAFKDGERTYRVVFGRRNNKSIVVIWRNMKDLDLEEDKKFIEEKVLSGNAYDLVFINGDSYIRDARAIEPEFKKLIEA